MDISGSRLIPASRAAVWAALGDADVLRRCLPGCERLAPVEDGGFEGAVAAKVGPLRTSLAGRAAPTEVEEGRRVAFTLRGEDEKAGAGEGAGEFTLDDDEGGTLVAYRGAFEATGKIAQLGPRLVGGFARQTIDAALARLAELAAEGDLPEAAPLAPKLPREPVSPGEADPAPETTRTLDETPPLADEGPLDHAAPEEDRGVSHDEAFAEPQVPSLAQTPIAPTAVPAVPEPEAIAAAEAADPNASSAVSRILLIAAIVIVVGFLTYVGLLQPR